MATLAQQKANEKKESRIPCARAARASNGSRAEFGSASRMKACRMTYDEALVPRDDWRSAAALRCERPSAPIPILLKLLKNP